VLARSRDAPLLPWRLHPERTNPVRLSVQIFYERRFPCVNPSESREIEIEMERERERERKRKREEARPSAGLFPSKPRETQNMCAWPAHSCAFRAYVIAVVTRSFSARFNVSLSFDVLFLFSFFFCFFW